MNVIQPFRRRIIFEAVIKALLIGLLIFGVAMVGVAATYIILNEELLAICIGVPVALALGLAVAIPVFLRVKEKKLSQLKYRLDSLGLQERVSTMAEFRHDKSYVAHVQREDTMNRLAGMPVSTLKIKVSRPLISVIAILLVIVMLLFILATPAAAVINPTQPEPVVPPDPTDEIIDEMIDEIDKIIEETPIPEEDKTEMKETIDEMKDKLDQAQTNEEKQEIIRDTANDLQHRVEQDEYNKEQILENLKKPDMDSSFEISFMDDLAESIEKIDQAQDKLDKAETDEERADAEQELADAKQELDQVLDDMYEDIMSNPDTESRKEQANEYANKLENAIKDTYQDEALHEAFEDLANKLKDPEVAPYPDDLKDAIDQAKDDIKNALEENQMNKDLSDTMEDARQEMLGNTDKTIEDMLDDLRDIVNNSDLTHNQKDELRDIVDNLEQNLENKKEQGASDTELSATITETRDEIMDYIENANKENQELGENLQQPSDKFYPPELEDAKQELGEAIQNNDKQGINEALDKLQDHYQQTEPGSAAEYEAIEDVKDIIKEALDKTQGDSEMKDALGEFVEDLEGALDDNDEQGWEDRREDADAAFDKAKENLGEIADSNADKEPTAEWMDKVMGNAQTSIWNDMPYEKPDKPESEQDSEKGDKGEQNKGEGDSEEDKQEKPEDKGEGTGDGSLTVDLDFEVWDPKKQEYVPLGQYLTLDMVQAEYDKMFERCDLLSSEEMSAIESYYTTLEAAVRQYRTENNLPLYSEGV